MARIQTYSQDSNVTLGDKLLGTDQTDNETRNFTLQSIVDLINSLSAVSVFDGILYRFENYDASNTDPSGVLNLNGGAAISTAFSSTTQIILSKKVINGSNVSNYLQFFQGKRIKVSQQDNFNVFGIFKVDNAQTWNVNSNYIQFNVTHVSSNGSLSPTALFFLAFVESASVTDFDGVTNAGSGQIITNAERTNLGTALQPADILDNVTSTDANKALSANQGKILKDLIDGLTALLDVDAADKPALDTLREVVNFCQLNEATLSSLGISSIAGLQAALNAKVDVVTGKELSENDFTNALLTKLNGIAAGAEVNIKPDFNATSGAANEILNIPTDITDLSAHNVTELSDVNSAFFTGSTATSLTDAGSGSIITTAERTKLTNIEDSADVTDTTNVTAAGALMDSEVTNLSQVKAFDAADYATAAQGAKADSSQQPPSEGAFVNGDKTKLDGIESNADVTDTTNVTAAGALMDSELANLAAVKAINQGLTTTDSVEFNNITQQGHRSIKHSDVVQDITVKVVTKTVAHPEHGNGSSLGYTIDDIEGAYLEFTPGNTYKFDQSDSSNANHPLRFYEDAAKNTAYTTGVTTSGTAGSSGAYTQIIPTTSTPPILFYQCSNHGLMGSYVKFGTGTVGDTYSIDVTQDGNNVDLKLDAASGTDSTVQLTAGSNITLTRNDAQQVTIASTASGLTVQEEGSSLSTDATTLNFTGSAVTASGTGATKTINVTGGDLTIQDEGSALTNPGSTLNFVGTGVTASGTGATKTITIPGAASGITIQEEGSTVGSAATTLNFVGSTVTATGSGATKTITVTGSAGSGGTTVARNTISGVSATQSYTLSQSIGDENNSYVFIDGVYQAKSTYSISGTTLTFNSQPPIGTDNIEVIHYTSAPAVTDVGVLQVDTFDGANYSSNLTLSIAPENKQHTNVFINGVYQEKSTYTLSGNTLTLTGYSATTGDTIEVESRKVITPSGVSYANMVSDTGTGDGSNQTFSTPNGAPQTKEFTLVYINGVYQSKSTYSLTSGNIVFTTAPDVGDEVEIISINSVNSASVAAVNSVNGQTGDVTLNTAPTVYVINSSTTAVANSVYVFTANLTLTLPASPSSGDSIKISNRSGVATCVLARNGSNIMGSASDLTLDTASASFELIYSDATNGWVIIGQ